MAELVMLEKVVWPTLEELSAKEKLELPFYQMVQVNFEGDRYYRFVRSQYGIRPHEKTVELAEKFKYRIGWELSGHPVALDSFVRELVKGEYDPLKITAVRGCDAKYLPFKLTDKGPHKIDFTLGGMSLTFGPPDNSCIPDLKASAPKHLNLYFQAFR
jgi:hypothetical protein